MAAVTIPADLEAWARAEVEAGRAQSVEALIARAIRGYRMATDSFKASLDRAVEEADRDGWIDGDDFLAELDEWMADLIIKAEAEEAGSKAAE